jgi:hypothetical protein
MVLMGQPNEETGEIDNPIVVNDAAELSDLRNDQGRSEGARSDSARPVADGAAAALLRLPHHGRAGDVVRAADDGVAFLLWRKRLYRSRWVLWALLLSFPLPYIANTAGWMTAELGRQPWLIYGLMRTSEGYSNTVSASNGLFTLIGFMGLYALLGLLFTVLIYREISLGPEPMFPKLFMPIEDAPCPMQRLGERVGNQEGGALAMMGFIWFWLVAVMIVGYVVLDGFDLGVGVLHLFLVRTEADRAHAGQHRPGVGRQRGVAAGRRRHALLRLSAAVRVGVQRVLSAADDRALAADAARRQPGAAQSHRRGRVARAAGRSVWACRARC